MNFAQPFENQILITANISKEAAKDEVMCALNCVKERRCKSYNFGPVSASQGMCELLSSDRFTPGAILQDKPEFIHVGMMVSSEGPPLF